MRKQILFSKMRAFTIIWFGQVVSLLGSGLTSFALGLWVYKDTASVTKFALVSLSQVPGIIIAPLAGAIVDRFDRRMIMLFSDSGSGISILTLALLFFTKHLSIWHIYVAIVASSIFGSFRWPAYNAATTLLIPPQYFLRANGMIQLGQSLSQLISPLLGSLLLVTVKIQGILLVDFGSFIFSLATLLLVRVPKLQKTTKTEESKSSLWHDVFFGFTYLRDRPGLLRLLVLFCIINFMLGVVGVLVTPLLISFTSETVLGIVLSIGGVGMVFGSFVISIWSGLKLRIYTLFSFLLLIGLCMILAGLSPNVWLVAIAAFFFFFSVPIMNSSSQAIFQSKVMPDVQGRVFAMNRMISGLSLPFAYLVAGFLADRIFEPLLSVNGQWAGSIGKIIGVGPGRGIGLLFIVMGTFTILATIIGYLSPRLRLVELELPDVISH